MNIRKLEDVLAEMRRAPSADNQMLRDWEARIAAAITDDLMAQINAAVPLATAFATEPGGHDWE